MSNEPFPTDAAGWLAKLVSFDTTSRNSNVALIAYVKEYLESHGAATHVVTYENGSKANLLATLPAHNGATDGGIILSGHTDVVPVDGQKWDSDPFVITERDGKLYGRGACDMKGFLAVALALAPTFAAAEREKPVHYAMTADEEVGCRGVVPLLKFMKEQGFRADCCLVGEPTNMEVITGNKGSASWSVTVRGKAIHSSLALMDTSCNAIEHAASIIAKIRAAALRLRETSPRDDAYDCPFTPVSTGLVAGGNAINTVPAACELFYGVRVTDRAAAQALADDVQRHIDTVVLPEMRREFPEASVTVVQRSNHSPFNAREDDPFTLLARALRRSTAVKKLGALTEAGYFVDYLALPTIICGPGGIDVAHQPNEFVSFEQLRLCQDFVRQLVEETTRRAR